MPHPLQAGWVELLAPVPVQDFGTFTFDKLRRLHPEAAHKKVRLLTRITNELLFGRDWMKHHPGIGTLTALEPHKDDRTHIHVLFYHPELPKDDPERRKLIRSLWEFDERWRHPRSLREGIARVLPAADDAAKAYCAKGYATKGGDLWIDDALMHYMQRKPWQGTLLEGN